MGSHGGDFLGMLPGKGRLEFPKPCRQHLALRPQGIFKSFRDARDERRVNRFFAWMDLDPFKFRQALQNVFFAKERPDCLL